MEFWRRCFGVFNTERVSNEKIRRMETGKETVTFIEEKKILIWYGHVRRQTKTDG